MSEQLSIDESVSNGWSFPTDSMTQEIVIASEKALFIDVLSCLQNPSLPQSNDCKRPNEVTTNVCSPSMRNTIRDTHHLRPGDRVNARDDSMDDYWIPPENRHWQPPARSASKSPRSQKSLKPPKVKEPTEEKNGKKTAAAPPPGGALSALMGVVATVSGGIGGAIAKGKAMQAKIRANKVAPIGSKVQARHLELEPLCCLSSCLVRGGCTAVVVFEAFYVIATFLVVLGGMSRGGFTVWEPLPSSWNAWFGHHIFYYAICVYDIALLCFLIALARGLLTFSKVLVRAHYLFCYVSLIVNIVFLVFSLWTLSSPGPFKWSATNCVLVFCFAMQIPLQLWAITVVKSCQDFFALIHVFVALAES